jgi:uncharacterized membrane protein
MAKDLGDAVGTALEQVTGKGGPAVPAGLAAGLGLAALAPFAAKNAGKLIRGVGGNGADPLKKVGASVKNAATEKVGESVKNAASEKLGGGDKKEKKQKGKAGVGEGRRMPVQQDIDIGVPIQAVYKHWTQFEEWPSFMHRLENVSQEDKKHLTFKTKMWGFSREFKAEIVDQRPEERIKWEVTEGVQHTGVVTFHEIGPRLTRVEVNIDVQPGSLLEKAARGMRHVKRAVRADLARFKAYVLMEEDSSSGPVSRAKSAATRASSSRRSSGRSSNGGRSRGSSSNGGRSRTRSSSSRRGSSS